MLQEFHNTDAKDQDYITTAQMHSLLEDIWQNRGLVHFNQQVNDHHMYLNDFSLCVSYPVGLWWCHTTRDDQSTWDTVPQTTNQRTARCREGRRGGGGRERGRRGRGRRERKEGERGREEREREEGEREEGERKTRSQENASLRCRVHLETVQTRAPPQMLVLKLQRREKEVIPLSPPQPTQTHTRHR